MITSWPCPVEGRANPTQQLRQERWTGVTSLYGFSIDLLAVRALPEDALGVEFAAHESLYLGGAYFRVGDSLILQENRELDDELREPDFRDARVLLYLETASAEREHAARLAQITGALLLRRDEV